MASKGRRLHAVHPSSLGTHSLKSRWEQKCLSHCQNSKAKGTVENSGYFRGPADVSQRVSLPVCSEWAWDSLAHCSQSHRQDPALMFILGAGDGTHGLAMLITGCPTDVYS